MIELTATAGCGDMNTLISDPRYDMLRCVLLILTFDALSATSTVDFWEYLN